MHKFVHLHMHSEYSILDGVSKITRIPEKAKELGMDAVALTDHGNIFGAVYFYKACKKNNIKPIIGCEVYVAKRNLEDKVSGIDNERYHLTLLVKNKVGYENLIYMLFVAGTEGMYYKPRIDKKLLENHAEGLVCLSGCLQGSVPKMILEDYNRGKQEALFYKSVFKDDYYLEIQENGIKEQKLLNQRLIRLSKELDIPLVATNDSHYEERENHLDQDILLAIQTGSKISDEERFKIDTDEIYIKSPEEMVNDFKNFPEAISNTVKIAEKCNFDFEFGETKLPKFVPDDGTSSEEYLKKLCREGIKNKYPDASLEELKVINARIKKELSVIIPMGFTDYFLIVQDFIANAKTKGIPIGPGRGSGAGSLIAHLIDITDIDPIKYDLMFERFLNPERVTMPDFDVDMCNERRDEVIKYVEDKYGRDHVAQIITFGTLSARMAVRDVGRVLDVPLSKVNKIAKEFPDKPKVKIDYTLSQNKDLKQMYDYDPEVKKVLDYAKKLEGMPRNISTHASGVVITDKPVVNYVPLYNNDNTIVTQYTMDVLEELGLLKMDFLGLRTLTLIDYTKKMIKEKYDVNIDELESYKNLDDPKVYKLWQRGDTLGVFQFESPGMIRFIKNLKPDDFEDIIAGVSLYRPGPMDHIPDYINGKKDPETIKYIDDSLKDILKVTYGIIVYQEQVMKIVRDLAGYSLARADIVRKAMGKKQTDIMKKEKEVFINGLTDDSGKVIVKGAVRNGISREKASKIFDAMFEFAKYAFNKSHAAAYAKLAYQTAYLKTYYRAEFLAAVMNSYSGNLSKIPIYIEDARNSGISITPPDINKSYIDFRVISEEDDQKEDDKKIIFGLGSIKNIGSAAAQIIIDEREKNGDYIDFIDFAERNKGNRINRKIVESLIKVGAFDSLNHNRATLLESFEEILAETETLSSNNNFNGNQVSIMDALGFVDPEHEENNSSKDKEKLYKIMPDMEQLDKLKYEKELIGIYVSSNPMEKIYPYVKHLVNFDSKALRDAVEKSESKSGTLNKRISIIGMIEKAKSRYTKNGKLMTTISLDDRYGNMEVLVFGDKSEKYRDVLKSGNIVGINANLKIELGRYTIYLDSMSKINIEKKKI